MIEINIFQTKTLTENNDRHPETVIERFLENAFDQHDVEYDITRGFDPVDTDREQSGCGEHSALGEWGDLLPEMDDEKTAKDSNVLLTNSSGGGCSYIGGWACTAPASAIDRDLEYVKNGREKIHWHIYSTLHEVGHNLGARHDHDKEMSGKQHRGTAWNEDPLTLFGVPLDFLPTIRGYYHKTPNVGGYDSINDCGEDIPARKYDAQVAELWYHDCAVEKFDIK